MAEERKDLETRDKQEKADPFDTEAYGGEPVIGDEGGGGWSGGGEGLAPERDASIAEDSPMEDEPDPSIAE